MTERNPLRLEIDNGVALITLDRPERRNAFNGAMGNALSEAYRHCDADDSIRAVVLTGTPPAFCAGADMSSGGETFARREEGVFSASGVDPPAWKVRKPVLAAINGAAIGIGLTLALQCDIRVVAEDAKLGIVQVRRGVMPDAFSHWTLSRIAGLAVAADLLLTGRTFRGDEAAQLGLASRCLPAEQVLPEVVGIARDIATNTAPVSVAVSKRLLWDAMELDREAVGHLETALHERLMGRSDAIEGVMAYLEHRAPKWNLTVGENYPTWPEGDSAEETAHGE
jgi:enoyl-CoA hydratase/carnithine racemase